MTAREFISSTMRLIGVLAEGETLSANGANDALTTLNQMLSSWSNENLLPYQKVRDEFTLTAADGSYTWGATAGAGNFTTARPVEVLSANIELQSGTQEVPLKILTTKEYAEIRLKQSTSATPQSVYFDGAFPNVGVEFYPVPSVAEHVVFYSLKPFSVLALGDTISYPPGYEKAIRYNFAIDLAPEYGRQVDPIIMQQAMDTKADIKRKNLQTPILKTDTPANHKYFNFLAGE